jgi:NTE family protein
MKGNHKTDIYIKPDIKDFGVISFDKGKEIIVKGEEATFAVYEKEALVGDTGSYQKAKLKFQRIVYKS